MSKLNDRLRHLRVDNGKEKEELATYLSISLDSYNRYERGTRQPDVESLVKLAIFYNVTLDFLLGRDELEMPVPNRDELISYRDLVELGLNPKLAHGLIVEIVSKQPFEERVCFGDGKIKYVKKEVLKRFLMKLLAMEL